MDNTQDPTQEQPFEIPDGSEVVRQSQWAWLWALVPWVGFAAVSVVVDQITFIGLPAVLALVVIAPRYIAWRRTAYILTDPFIVFQVGGLTGVRRFNLPVSEMETARARPGMWGTTLGYRTVELRFKNKSVAMLPYVPIRSPLLERLQPFFNAPPVEADNPTEAPHGETPPGDGAPPGRG